LGDLHNLSSTCEERWEVIWARDSVSFIFAAEISAKIDSYSPVRVGCSSQKADAVSSADGMTPLAHGAYTAGGLVSSEDHAEG
jgi:hypothetical protein